MKVLSFFSRVAVVCNVAFILFIFFSRLEAQKHATHARDTVAAVPFLKNLIITLGILAIVVNLIMCIVYAVVIVLGKQRLLPKTLMIINFLFFIFQIFYFFFRQA